eukprot:NODE_9102_length_382_cov_46.552553_g8204_i0.p1 GENE.NODE_9102_length_382_cov_46.552553_g8204_i0~~NODE_9102_length_382_cov_46.552553_g8204_i0.p1  ORF type:complete len:108 (+),score=36.13 NODE_9102_length_382_cov_46.552553_g8204_i0:32-325(+)
MLLMVFGLGYYCGLFMFLWQAARFADGVQMSGFDVSGWTLCVPATLLVFVTLLLSLSLKPRAVVRMLQKFTGMPEPKEENEDEGKKVESEESTPLLK